MYFEGTMPIDEEQPGFALQISEEAQRTFQGTLMGFVLLDFFHLSPASVVRSRR